MTHNTCGKKNLRGGGGCPSKAIIGIVISLLLSIVGSPVLANAATTTTTTTTVSEQYQLYNQKTRDQQVSINKVWNDGLTNDTRILFGVSRCPGVSVEFSIAMAFLLSWKLRCCLRQQLCYKMLACV